MAQRQMEERMEIIDKEIIGIKEAIMSLGKNMEKSIEKLSIEIRETQKTIIHNRGESSMVRSGATSVAGEMTSLNGKGKEKDEEIDQTLVRRDSIDRCKIRKLEMPPFDGDSPDSWLYKAEFYFEINLLTDAEKRTVSVISFAPAVVDWY